MLNIAYLGAKETMMENVLGILAFSILAIIVLAIDIWAILDIAKFPLDRGRKKWIWTNIVMLLPIAGGLIYFYVGKKDLLATNR
ncbi:PLDc N-terminal domain-containing protein [Pedobacter sp. KR3-3]|uniref:PLDc N-terminal domain-containing protein n=1 Tax=Pedobacter albus TaxID=3113905 RepID=A0ABU7I4G1_9SPHI|nr:PLDc N-terminal domain-containing protein [Pedobacter sp. KR3-3]MEE1944345.1 PLDc N-terminal domain-containing protein [Pedobacter sp. KR3-3]